MCGRSKAYKTLHWSQCWTTRSYSCSRIITFMHKSFVPDVLGSKSQVLKMPENMVMSESFFWPLRFTFVIGFLVLLSGAVLNDQHGDETMYFGNNCYVLKSGVFATGSVLSLATVIIGILYYVTLSSAKNREDLWGGSMLPPSQGGIAMGQPQLPPPPQTSQPPLFVHEETYNR